MKQNDPIFVLGVGRSGTTLLALMLDAHSKIAIPHESHFMIPYYNKKESFGDLTQNKNKIKLLKSIFNEPYIREWDCQISIDDMDLKSICNLEGAICQIYQLYAKHFNKDIWGDKTPIYISDIPILNKMFPTARFIHIIRDGRDVALSIMRMWWGANDFMSAIQYWKDTVYCARKMLNMLPNDRFIELKYEDLVANPKQELSRVVNFLGIEYEDTMLEYSKKARTKVGQKRIHEHHVHLVEKPIRSQAFKWKNTLKPVDQAIANEIAGEIFTEIGYPQGVREHPLKSFRKIYHRCKESYEWRFK